MLIFFHPKYRVYSVRPQKCIKPYKNFPRKKVSQKCDKKNYIQEILVKLLNFVLYIHVMLLILYQGKFALYILVKSIIFS